MVASMAGYTFFFEPTLSSEKSVPHHNFYHSYYSSFIELPSLLYVQSLFFLILVPITSISIGSCMLNYGEILNFRYIFG